ncbi:MAG: RNA methyltransferase [Zetaproteobacteria bacterium]|nr:MAG: RNA methyltransferase [Zetaproteobacteria bacterium]
MDDGVHVFAVVLPGLETIAARELAALGARTLRPAHGGVAFRVSPTGLMRISLRARVPTRLLVRLAEFRACSFPELFNKARRLRWEHYVRRDGEVHVRAESHRSRLLHSGRLQAVLRDAVHARLRRADATDGRPRELTVYLRMYDDRCQLSLDASGERLDRRGYRRYPGRAPLRETLAAALLQWLDWRAEQRLWVPMCGSGTLAIEGALMAAQCAPGVNHRFPFVGWPGFTLRRWRQAMARAERMRRKPSVRIHASDLDPRAVAWTRANAACAGVEEMLSIEKRDFFALDREGEQGVLLLNPPYGRRIGGDARALYARIGRHLAHAFAGWRCLVLAPDQACVQALGMPALDALDVRHGGRTIHAVQLIPGAPVAAAGA